MPLSRTFARVGVPLVSPDGDLFRHVRDQLVTNEGSFGVVGAPLGPGWMPWAKARPHLRSSAYGRYRWSVTSNQMTKIIKAAASTNTATTIVT